MKYLAAATDPNLDAVMFKRFGHAPYWLVIDSETMRFTVIEGEGEDHPRHGLDRILGLGVKRAIVGNIGPHAFGDLKTMGIAIFSCHRLTVREALEKVERGDIAELTEPTMKVSVHEGRGEGGRYGVHSNRERGEGHRHH